MNASRYPGVPSERTSGFFPLSNRSRTTLLVLLLLAGAAMRLYKFPAIPIGLHWDEMSEAYESYALLHTGADRWGYRLPVYFLSWGSGQNVLQSYLSIPVVAIFGLTRLSARLVPVICGVFTLPLFFLAIRRWYGETAALFGLLFLAFSPWHVMLSRWGIENSPLPFFMILGIYTFGKALDSRSSWVIVPALIPFALALYTYGVAILVVPELLLILMLVGLQPILARRRAWTAAVALFIGLSLPIAFFTFKNYVTKHDYGFERYLPISIPLVPVTRLSQVRGVRAIKNIPLQNLHFILNGFSDERTWRAIFQPWYQIPGILPVQLCVELLAAVGLFLQVRHLIRTRRFSEPFFPWLLCCAPLFVLFPLNISRANPIFLPILGLAAFGAVEVLRMLPRPRLCIAVTAGYLVLFAVPSVWFIHDYFGRTYAKEITPLFRPQLPEAVSVARQLASSAAPVYIGEKIQNNYVQWLFFTQTDPRIFQHANTTYVHPDFGRYHFSMASLHNTSKPFVFLIDESADSAVCAAPVDTTQVGPFLVGECN